MKRQRSRKGAPGIVEVARRAGVSPATVSRFYNEPDIVRHSTRVKIETAAKDLGYIRDRMAGALQNRFSGTIGLVVPTIDNAIFSELIEAFSTQLQIHDRTMLIASHNYNLALEVSIIRSLLERRIDGVAIVGHEHTESAMSMLEVRDIPVVALWNYKPHVLLSCIGVDNAAAAAKVTQYLLDIGHRDIAFLFPDTDNNDRARDRKEGALVTMQQAGFSVPEHRIMSCPYDISQAKSVAIDVIRTNKPTAIVCGNDIIAHGVIYAGIQLGLSLPDDLSVVGIGDFNGSEAIEPGLTTVRLPARRIGKQAADRLVQMNESRIAPRVQHTELDTELIVRQSTRPR